MSLLFIPDKVGFMAVIRLDRGGAVPAATV
jgi:hypothetical protein